MKNGKMTCCLGFPYLVKGRYVLVNRVRRRQVTIETRGNDVSHDVIEGQVTDVLVVISLGHAVPASPQSATISK